MWEGKYTVKQQDYSSSIASTQFIPQMTFHQLNYLASTSTSIYIIIICSVDWTNFKIKLFQSVNTSHMLHPVVHLGSALAVGLKIIYKFMTLYIPVSGSTGRDRKQ